MSIGNSILIIEDEFITAIAIEELLKEEDYLVLGIAADGVKALELCEQALEPPPCSSAISTLKVI